jgi:hypothetical protein
MYYRIEIKLNFRCWIMICRKCKWFFSFEKNIGSCELLANRCADDPACPFFEMGKLRMMANAHANG